MSYYKIKSHAKINLALNVVGKYKKYWAPVARVDNVFGDRNLVCSCPSMDEYKDEAA